MVQDAKVQNKLIETTMQSRHVVSIFLLIDSALKDVFFYLKTIDIVQYQVLRLLCKNMSHIPIACQPKYAFDAR